MRKKQQRLKPQYLIEHLALRAKSKIVSDFMDGGAIVSPLSFSPLEKFYLQEKISFKNVTFGTEYHPFLGKSRRKSELIF